MNLAYILCLEGSNVLAFFFDECHSVICFCLQKHSDPTLIDDPAKDPQFKEHAIDILRTQKDEVNDNDTQIKILKVYLV